MRSSVEVSACPLCGSDALAPLPVPTRTVGRELFAGCAPPLGLRACRACTFAFVSPRPDPATLVRFYQRSDYTAHEPVDGTAATRRARRQLDEVDRAGLPVTGEHVLDLGCGGGVAGIAAARDGAKRVYANDIDPPALEMCARNAAANQVQLQVDGADLLERGWPGDTGLILVGDLFYEREMSDRLIDWLRRARRGGIAVLIADSSRPFGPRTDVRLLEEETVPTDWDLEGTRNRTVRLLTLEA